MQKQGGENVFDNVIQAENREEYVKLRKYGNKLAVSGWGVMILGIWGAVRAVMSMYIFRDEIIAVLFEEDISPNEMVVAFTIFSIFIFAIYAVSMLIHLYIGKCAIAEGKGKKKKNLYLVFAAVIVAFSLVSQSATEDEEQYVNTEEMADIDTAFATDLLDLTLSLSCAEMIYCAVRTRMLKRKIEKTAQTKGTEQ